jgi:hypothetical protein
MDNLSYGYATNENKLLTVTDNSTNTGGFNDANESGNDYAYDGNGNYNTPQKLDHAIVFNVCPGLIKKEANLSAASFK